MDDQFQWVDFYKEFAGGLLACKNNRKDLIEKLKAIYGDTGINMTTLERDNQLVDMDPFTVFGLFNKSSMREANRIKIITAVRELFDVETAVPTSFDSIPVPNNQNATFYYFDGDRGANAIDDLWGLFEAGLSYASNPTPDALKVTTNHSGTTQQNADVPSILHNIDESLELKTMWDNYCKQFAYAADIEYSKIVDVQKVLIA